MASEIAGCLAALEWAEANYILSLTIINDCDSVVEIINSNESKYRLANDLRKKYNSLIQRGMKIKIEKIKAHVGNHYGDLADALARYSLGKDIKLAFARKIRESVAIDWERNRRIILKSQKTKERLATIKEEDYSKIAEGTLLYRINEQRKVAIGKVFCVHKNNGCIESISALFNRQFITIPSCELGQITFVRRSAADKKLNEMLSA
jgi:ribonuclease HI